MRLIGSTLGLLAVSAISSAWAAEPPVAHPDRAVCAVLVSHFEQEFTSGPRGQVFAGWRGRVDDVQAMAPAMAGELNGFLEALARDARFGALRADVEAAQILNPGQEVTLSDPAQIAVIRDAISSVTSVAGLLTFARVNEIQNQQGAEQLRQLRAQAQALSDQARISPSLARIAGRLRAECSLVEEGSCSFQSLRSIEGCRTQHFKAPSCIDWVLGEERATDEDLREQDRRNAQLQATNEQIHALEAQSVQPLGRQELALCHWSQPNHSGQMACYTLSVTDLVRTRHVTVEQILRHNMMAPLPSDPSAFVRANLAARHVSCPVAASGESAQLIWQGAIDTARREARESIPSSPAGTSARRVAASGGGVSPAN